MQNTQTKICRLWFPNAFEDELRFILKKYELEELRIAFLCFRLTKIKN